MTQSLRQAANLLPKHEQKHFEHKLKRNDRFAQGIYGVVQEPIISKDILGFWDPPSYLSSRHTVKYRRASFTSGIDWRCFYSGVVCSPPVNLKSHANHDSKVMPWMGTKDHLVPLRKGLNDRVDLSHLSTSLVWTSNVINQTIGLAPLPVRLKIREWLSTTAFDRNDLSIESGQNLRWIIIDMLNEFRINGRFPWSRKLSGAFWYPEISGPLMQKWHKMEYEFLLLNEYDRDQYIKSFVWQF